MQQRYPDNSVSFLLTTIGLLVLLVGFLLAAWNGQIVITTVLGIALAAGALSKLWSRFCLSGVSCSRVLKSRRVFPGENVTLEMQLSNRKLLPLPWIQVDDELPLLFLPGETSSPENRTGYGFLSKAAAMLWYSRVSWSSQLLCPRRGYYTLGPLRITSGDIFGFHNRSKSEAMPEHIIVYPKILPVAHLPVLASYPLGNCSADRPIFEDPLRAMGVRDYSPHDSIKKIHWKATAREQKLQVKLLEPTTTAGAAIFVSVDSYLGEHISEADFEYGISAAAGIARYMLRGGNATGLYVNTLSADLKLPVRVPPGNTPVQMRAILEALAKVTGYSSGNFVDFIHRERKALSWGMTLIMVLHGVHAPLESVLSRLREAGYKVVVYETGVGGQAAYAQEDTASLAGTVART
jgi:uncharacterized protein (DUF58 family)